MIKTKNRGGFIDRHCKRVGVEEEENRRFFLTLADVFEKNEKKNKTTSVYRLFPSTFKS